jgi:hypothetical protein
VHLVKLYSFVKAIFVVMCGWLLVQGIRSNAHGYTHLREEAAHTQWDRKTAAIYKGSKHPTISGLKKKIIIITATRLNEEYYLTKCTQCNRLL